MRHTRSRWFVYTVQQSMASQHENSFDVDQRSRTQFQYRQTRTGESFDRRICCKYFITDNLPLIGKPGATKHFWKPTGRQLLRVLRFLFRRLYGLDPQGEQLRHVERRKFRMLVITNFSLYEKPPVGDFSGEIIRYSGSFVKMYFAERCACYP